MDFNMHFSTELGVSAAAPLHKSRVLVDLLAEIAALPPTDLDRCHE